MNDVMGTQTSALRSSTAGEPINYKKFEGYLDNLSHAATNKKVVLQQLSTAFTLFTSNNAMIVEQIKALTTNNKYLGGMARSASFV